MFNKKLKLDLAALEGKVEDLYENRPPTFVECEVCGCLLSKFVAHKGDPEIKKGLKTSDKGFLRVFEVDVIYYPWYCKVHKPKATKKKAK